MNHTNDPTTTQATQWLAQFDRALTQSNIPAALTLFANECYWRDLVSFTWNIVTMESSEEIREMLTTTLTEIQPSAWALTELATKKDRIVEGWFTFETAVGMGQGIFRLHDWRLGHAFDAERRTSSFINYDIKYCMGDDLVAGDA